MVNDASATPHSIGQTVAHARVAEEIDRLADRLLDVSHRIHADPELEDLVRTDPSELVRGYMGSACERCSASLEDGGSECAQCHRTVCGNCNSRCAYCGEAACDDCGMYCAGCHRWFCGMHLTSGRCPSCA